MNCHHVCLWNVWHGAQCGRASACPWWPVACLWPVGLATGPSTYRDNSVMIWEGFGWIDSSHVFRMNSTSFCNKAKWEIKKPQHPQNRPYFPWQWQQPPGPRQPTVPEARTWAAWQGQSRPWLPSTVGNPDHHHTGGTPIQKIPRATIWFEGRDPSYCSEAPPPSPKSGWEGTSQLLPPPGCFFFPTPCYFLSPLSPLPLKPFYELSRVTCTSSKNNNRLSPWGKILSLFYK